MQTEIFATRQEEFYGALHRETDDAEGKAKAMRLTGTIKTWNENKGYGFARRDDGEGDVFIHVSAIDGDAYDPVQGDRVEFEIGINARNGKEQAQKVTVVSS